jgi:hypothetical protein
MIFLILKTASAQFCQGREDTLCIARYRRVRTPNQEFLWGLRPDNSVGRRLMPTPKGLMLTRSACVRIA